MANHAEVIESLGENDYRILMILVIKDVSNEHIQIGTRMAGFRKSY